MRQITRTFTLLGIAFATAACTGDDRPAEMETGAVRRQRQADHRPDA